MVQQGLLWVDVLGLFANVLADVSAGRSSLSLEGGTLSIGLDTLASSWTLAMSNTPLPSVPGVYWNMFWDAMQLYYDAARMSGGLPGYSLVVQWK